MPHHESHSTRAPPPPPLPPLPSQDPIHLSQIQFTDPETTPTLYTTLKTLKKSTLSIHKRLASILSDAEYVADTVHAAHFPDLPLLANERCGSWYIPPRLKFGSAYFKSTDGHYGQWDFSLRRLNLQVLEGLGRFGGAVLVDSTRRGKRMPDALRRTVPIWCLVWNRVLFPEFGGVGDRDGDGGGEGVVGWVGRLQHPGLEPGEVDLIERRVDGWLAGLRGLGLNLEELRRKVKKPIRCRWVVHGETFECEDDESRDVREGDCNLLVLCSASRRVIGAEMSEDGYIQGAGDDAEGWSGGLTSQTFWSHTDDLMNASEEELPELIAKLIQESKAQSTNAEAIQIKPTNSIFVTAASSVGDIATMKAFDLVISCNKTPLPGSISTLDLNCRSGKLGSRDLRDQLQVAYDRALGLMKRNKNGRILIICENGRDLSVGVAVMLLCLLYNDEGLLSLPQPSVVDKQLVKRRLAWVTTVQPDTNPSRSTLQAVNSFLMERPD